MPVGTVVDLTMQVRSDISNGYSGFFNVKSDGSMGTEGWTGFLPAATDWTEITIKNVKVTTGQELYDLVYGWAGDSDKPYVAGMSIDKTAVGIFFVIPNMALGQTVSLKEIYLKEVAAVEYSTPQVALKNAGYEIVIPAADYSNANSAVKYAADLLKANLLKAGVSVTVVSDASASGAKAIYLGRGTKTQSKLFSCYDSGKEAYRLINYNGDLIIAANSGRGYIYGAYGFLESLGYAFISPDVTVVPDSSDVFIAAGLDVITGNSPFDYRELMYSPYACVGTGDDTVVTEYAIANGINGSFWRNSMKNNAKFGGYEGFIGGDSFYDHNVVGWLLPLDYLAEHEEYFGYQYYNDAYDCATWVDYLRTHGETPSVANLQVCISNPDVLTIVISYLDTRINNAIDAALASGIDYPKVISVCAMDNWNYCNCPNCTALYNTYGRTGAWLRFINKIADHCATWHPEMTINTYSYGWTKGLPKTRAESDGNYVDNDYLNHDVYTVVPRSNVNMQLATTMCPFHCNPDECATLAAEENQIKEWAKISNSLYVWYYATDFLNYNAVWPNFDAIWYDIQFFANNKVKGVYVEGNGCASGEFGELRSYLISKMLQNPYMTIDEFNALRTNFLNNYYGAAGQYINNYINDSLAAINTYYRYYGHTVLLPNYEVPTDQYIYLDNNVCTTIDGYWASALSAVNGNAMLTERVEKSKMHWDYTKYYYAYNLYNCSTKPLYDKMVQYDFIYPNEIDVFKPVTNFNTSTKNWQAKLKNS